MDFLDIGLSVFFIWSFLLSTCFPINDLYFFSVSVWVSVFLSVNCIFPMQCQCCLLLWIHIFVYSGTCIHFLYFKLYLSIFGRTGSLALRSGFFWLQWAGATVWVPGVLSWSTDSQVQTQWLWHMEGLSCPATRGTFWGQELNPCPLQCQVGTHS